jgi:hypothetical protein
VPQQVGAVDDDHAALHLISAAYTSSGVAARLPSTTMNLPFSADIPLIFRLKPLYVCELKAEFFNWLMGQFVYIAATRWAIDRGDISMETNRTFLPSLQFWMAVYRVSHDFPVAGRPTKDTTSPPSRPPV